MKITDEQAKKIQEKLKTLNLKCVNCANSDLTVVDKLFELREFEGGSLVVGGESSLIPLVVFICDKCGELKLVSALKLGLLDTSEKKVNDNVKEEE